MRSETSLTSMNWQALFLMNSKLLQSCLIKGGSDGGEKCFSSSRRAYLFLSSAGKLTNFHPLQLFGEMNTFTLLWLWYNQPAEGTRYKRENTSMQLLNHKRHHVIRC
jgi:hypothetical protein